MSNIAIEGIERGGKSIRLGWDGVLQRLFSTFPDGFPGLGLLLLRLGAGVGLMCLGITAFFRAVGEPITLTTDLVSTVTGVFLLVGLWTPVMGVVAAANELWIMFSLYSFPRDAQWNHILLAVLAGGVAMLGPGAWSIDARLFGRKRLDIEIHKSK